MKFYRKKFQVILGGVLAAVTPVVIALAGGNGSNMIEYYCSPNSLFLWLDLSRSIYCGGAVIVTHVILASSFFMVLFYFIARLSDARSRKLESIDSSAVIDLKKLRLAKGGFINYPESKFHNVSVEEYTFTVINETGQDLKKCFVLLDEVWVKEDRQTKGLWRLEAKDVFDKPFRWTKQNLPVDGKIDINNNDRVSFVLVELNRSSILNPAENRNEPYLDFRLAMLGTKENSHALYTGWNHRLIFTIRGRDSGDNDLSVKYSIYLYPHNAKGLVDIKIVREKQKKVS